MPDIRFFDWSQPFLPSVARTLVAGASTGTGIDLSGTLLVCPGRRAGRRLLELLVDEAERSGDFLVPPNQVMTIGALPERLYEPRKPLAPDPVTRRAWFQALSETESETLRDALGIHIRGSEPQGLLGYARLLDSLNRSVGRAGLSFRSVARECRAGFLFSDEERWEALAEVQEAMRRLLFDADLLDKQEARRRALEEPPSKLDHRVVLVGVAECPLVTRRLLSLPGREVSAFVHAADREAGLFDDLGFVKPDAWSRRRIPMELADLRVCDQPSDQAREVARVFEGLPGEGWENQVVIGVPDPGLVPFVMKGVEVRGIRARYAEGTPMRVTAPVQLLRVVADYLSSRAFAALGHLVRHPHLPPTLHPDSAPEWADSYFERRLPDTLGPEDITIASGSDSFIQLLHILEGPEFLGSLENTATLSEWMPRVLGFLSAIYADQPIPADPSCARLLVEPLLHLRDVAESLSALPPTLDGDVTASHAIRVLLSEVQDATIPPEAEEAAVELVGWLELQLDDPRIAIITGISDPVLPESVNADPYLPNALRTRLGIDDNESRYARDAYRLTALLHSTESVVLIAGRRSASGDPLRPSRLLLTGEAEDLARAVLRLTGEIPGEEPMDGLEPEAEEQAESPAFILPPEPELPLLPIPEPFPVTGFRGILADPYLWVLERVRRLEAIDDSSLEMDPADFGTLAHAVLEGFARSGAARSTSSKEIRRMLDAILNDLVQRTFASQPLPTVPLQVEQLRTRLHSFSEFQAAWAQDGWVTRYTEARTPDEGVPLDVDGRIIQLAGRVDRIDHRPATREWILFDYKTGDKGADLAGVRTRKGVWKDLQLPLYRFLLPSLVSGGVPLDPAPGPGDAVKVAYLPLHRMQKEIAPVIPPWTEKDISSAVEEAREVFRRLGAQRVARFDPMRTGTRARGAMAALLGRGVFQAAEVP